MFFLEPSGVEFSEAELSRMKRWISRELCEASPSCRVLAVEPALFYLFAEEESLEWLQQRLLAEPKYRSSFLPYIWVRAVYVELRLAEEREIDHALYRFVQWALQSMSCKLFDESVEITARELLDYSQP